MKTFFKIIGGIFAFIFCVALLLVELIGHGIFGFNSLVSEKKIDRIIDATNISYLLKDEDDNKTKVYKEVSKLTKDIGLTDEEMGELVNSTGFKNILKELAQGMKEKYIYNTKEYALYEMEITNLINANLDNMIANTNKNINYEDREVLSDFAAEKINELVENLPSFNEARSKYSELKYTSMLLDIKVKLAIVGAAIILTLLIALVTWSLSKGLKCSGIITMVLSFVVIIVGLLTSFVLSYILHNIPSLTDYISVLKPALKEIGLVFISDGLITLGASIIMLTLASLLTQRRERKEEQGTILAN